jgi:hypothetical protein
MNDIITQLTESTKNGATFMTFLYTSKGTGETSKYQINFGIDYKAACDHDRKALVAYVPSNELEIQAKEEMLKSLTETLEEGVSSSYTQKDRENLIKVSFVCLGFERAFRKPKICSP